MKKKPHRKNARKSRSKCRALISLDTSKIRKSELNKFKRNKSTCASLTTQAEHFEKEDVPAYQKWMHTHCGSLQEQIHTAQHDLSALQNILFLTNQLCDFYPEYTEKECADAAVQYMREKGETPKGFEEFFGDDQPPEKEENDPFCSSEEEDYTDEKSFEDAQEFLNSMMDDIFGGVDSDFPQETLTHEELQNEEKAIKKLYRKIARKLHPDKTINATPEQQELWHAAKTAYETSDIETLKHIDTHSDLFNKSHLKSASISAIRNGIAFYKETNKKIRRALRQMKYQPEWGFASWSDKKKKQIQTSLRTEMNEELQYFLTRRASIQHLVDQIRTPPKKRAPKKKKQSSIHKKQSQFEFF